MLVPPILLLWKALTLSKFKIALTTSIFSKGIWLSCDEDPESKKCMTPFPDLIANACAVNAISCASCNVSDWRNVKPEFRIEVIEE
jgi:hypothetical protein